MSMPIGYVYISATDISPSEKFGGEWVRIAEGKTLWGAADGETAGEEIQAGLPNITGSEPTHIYTNRNDVGNMSSGLFVSSANAFQTRIWSQGSNMGTGGSTYAGRLRLDASKCNSIYGNSTTVQPPAVKAHIFMRFK